MNRKWKLTVPIALLVAAILVMAVAPAAQAAPNTAPNQSCGYWYTVQPGDSWSKLSAHTGISVYALRSANPSHIHPYNWLYVGHSLYIPCSGGTPPPGCDYWYTVKSGDSWSKLSSWTGISVYALQSANPSHIHQYNWLYVGHKLYIPCGAPPPPPPPPPPPSGYWYTVQPGNTWSGLSAWTGIPVSTLQAANPSHIHPHYWLYVGHKLWIPTASPY